MEMIKILLVDDEEGLTRLMKLNLEQTGKFTVRTENRGSAALAAAKAFRPDLVILDIIMPDMEGSDVMRQFKQDASLKNVPVLFLTATVMKGEGNLASSGAGGYTFVAKPVTAAELIAEIEKKLA